jgi:hypothetical protein
MIRHIVLLKFRKDVTPDAIAALFAELHGIEGKVAGLISITSGFSESPEQMERGYMHGFVADFEDWGALQTYQDHPAHKALGANLVAATVGGIDGILVFDLPVTVGTAKV